MNTLYTLQNLQQSLSLVESMSLEDIEHFSCEYRGQRAPKLRLLIKERKRDLNQQQRIKERVDWLYKFINGKYVRIKDIHKQPNVEQYVHIHARSIAQDVYDCTSVWTGFESVENKRHRLRAEEKGNKYKHSDEHFWPRQHAGLQICKTAIVYGEQFNIRHLITALNKYCQVHHVTPKENIELRKHQKPGVFINPDHAYSNANVVLIPDENFVIDPIYEILWDDLDEVIKRNP